MTYTSALGRLVPLLNWINYIEEYPTIRYVLSLHNSHSLCFWTKCTSKRRGCLR